MRKIFIIVSFLLLNIAHTGDCLAENAVLAGRITLQNSGGKPLGGVQVSARKATPTASRSNGHFDLVFQDKKPGDRVWLALEKNGYEVVNRDSLKVVIRANPDDIVVFVMCTEGERDRHALIYYEIAQDNINKRYVQEIKRVNDNYEKTLKEKNDELEKLKMQRDAALAQAKDLAEKFAEANLDEASEMYKQAFKLFREGKVKDALKVLDDEKMDRAMAKAQKIKQEAEKEIGKGVENYMLKARLCITDFRFDEAEKNFQKAVQAGPDDYDNIFEFALYLQKQNQYVRALPLYENALSIAEKKQDKDGEATTLNNLGVLYRNSNDYPAAAKAYKRSLEIREKLAKDNPDTYLPDVANTLNNMGIFYWSSNDYPAAAKAYKNSMEIKEKLAEDNPDTYLPNVAMTLNNLGVLYNDSNDYPAATKAYKRSLEIREKLAEDNPDAYLPDVAMTLNNLGNFYYNSNDYPAAAKAYKRSLEIREKLAEDNPDTYLPDVAATLNNLGILHKDSNDYPAAAKAYKRSLEIREKLAEDNPDTYLPDVAMTLNNLGILYRNSNDYPAAAKAYKRVLEIRERLAKSNPKVYELDLCATLGSISSLQVSLLERDPKESYKEKGLFLTQRAITILEKYKEIPKAQKYMEALVTIKTTLENISVENLKTLKAAQDFIKKGDEIIKNKGTAEDAISNYKKAIEAYEKLIAKERNTEYLLKTVDIYNTLNSIEKDAKTRIQNQEKITAIWYEIYQEQQDNEKVKQNLSQAYGYMSWYLLFDKQFKKTEQYSLKGLKLDPSQEWISINLASAYLFTGQYNKAVAIYTKLKDKPYNENKTYKDIFLEDLNELEKAGITHPDAEKVRRLLKLP